jgi:phospholipid/cholesterol/gamma-HCH transport system substrate-binding protein
VAKFTEKFSTRSEDVERILDDTRQLAERLNKASVRVDGILVKVDNLLGSDDAQGVMVDLRETLDAYKQVADTLNAKLGPITDGLARFSGKGLRDVEALVGDSRRAIGRIESAISDLERNPQRIISGGDGTVRQYDGRARR